MLTRPLGPDLPAVTIVGYGGMHLSIDGRPSGRCRRQGDPRRPRCRRDADRYRRRVLSRPHRHRPQRTAHRPGAAGVARQPGEHPRGDQGRPGPAHRALGQRRASSSNCGRPATGRSRRSASSRSHSTSSTRWIPTCRSRRASARWPICRRAGKIRAIGLSNVSVDEIKRGEKVATISTVQNRLNPFFREAISEGVVDYCADAGDRVPRLQPNRRRAAHQEAAVASRCCSRSPTGSAASPHAGHHRLGPSRREQTVFAIPSSEKVEHALDGAGAGDCRSLRRTSPQSTKPTSTEVEPGDVSTRDAARRREQRIAMAT